MYTFVLVATIIHIAEGYSWWVMQHALIRVCTFFHVAIIVHTAESYAASLSLVQMAKISAARGDEGVHIRSCGSHSHNAEGYSVWGYAYAACGDQAVHVHPTDDNVRDAEGHNV